MRPNMLGYCLRPLILCATVIAPLLSGYLVADTVDDVKETRETMLEVVRLRETLSKEKRAWLEQKEVMQGQLRLDRLALEQLEVRLTESRPLLESLLEEASRLEADIETYAKVVEFWRDKLGDLKLKIAQIVGKMPPLLRNEVTPKLRDLQSLDLERGGTSLKRAFDISLEIINEANAFNLEIHGASEVHVGEDGEQRRFRVIYLGLSCGYYYSEEAGLAGHIAWDDDGWSWLEDNRLLGDLVAFESVRNSEEPPQFMAMPFTMPQGGSQ